MFQILVTSKRVSILQKIVTFRFNTYFKHMSNLCSDNGEKRNAFVSVHSLFYLPFPTLIVNVLWAGKQTLAWVTLMLPSVWYLLMKFKIVKLTVVTYCLSSSFLQPHPSPLSVPFLFWEPVAERRSSQSTKKSQRLRSDQLTGLDSFFQSHSLFLVCWTETIHEKPHRCGSCVTSPSSHSFHNADLEWLFSVTELPAISNLSLLPTWCL